MNVKERKSFFTAVKWLKLYVPCDSAILLLTI